VLYRPLEQLQTNNSLHRLGRSLIHRLLRCARKTKSITTMAAKVKAEPVAETTSSSNTQDMMIVDDDDQEEDEIAREIDVFLSPELASQMYLMQFPLQQRALSLPEAARVKSRHQLMELDYQTPENIQEFGQYHMPSRTYTSHTIPVSTHLALGKMINEPGAVGLHLVPLTHITQMRPTFHHVDEAMSTATKTADDELKREKAEAAKIERKPLAFQKKESERAAIARKSSYAYKKASEESEPWHSLQVHEEGSAASNEVLKKMVCPRPHQHLLVNPANEQGDESSSHNLYVHSLNYLPVVHTGGQEREDRDQGMESICTKLVGLLHRGWPVPFSLIRNQFPESVSNETIFTALESCTFMIRGNYILQSRLLSLAPAVAQARTFILFLFQAMDMVYRSRLDQVYEGNEEVTLESIKMLLRQVGQKTSGGWKLKVEDDIDFAQAHPETVLKHLEFWGKQVARFGPLLQRYQADS
jgi:DNA-directed RNA polymerase-3 subunit RPC5